MLENKIQNVSIVISYMDQAVKTTFPHFTIDATNENILTIAEKIASLKKFDPIKFIKVEEGLLVE